MANITLHIAGRNYPITCGDGEEDHAFALAKSLDVKISEATNGQSVTEIRGLLFGGLLLADALLEAEADIKKSEKALTKAVKAVKDSEQKLAESKSADTQVETAATNPSEAVSAAEPDLMGNVVNDAMIANAVKALDKLAARIEDMADRIESTS